MYGQGLLKGMGITLRHFFGKAITQQYPDAKPNFAPRFHGAFELNAENCNACGNCVTACPNNVIVIESERDQETKKRYPVRFTINMDQCLYCGLCVENCNRDGLHFTQEYELAAYDKGQIARELIPNK